MPLNLFDKDATYSRVPAEHMKYKGKSVAALDGTLPAIIPSDKLTGIELRLLPPYVIENGTDPFTLLPGFSKLYCLVIVVSDVNNQLVGGIDLQGFPRIGDKEYLPINKTVFYWQQADGGSKPPSQIHIMCSIIKSKKALRNTGKILEGLKDDSDYQSITKTIASLAKKSTPVGAAMDILTQLGGLVGRHLKDVEDKPLGTIINSYTSLYGDFNTLGITRKKYPVKKIEFEFELIVRDSTQQTTIVKSLRSAKGAKQKTVVMGQEDVVVEMMTVK